MTDVETASYPKIAASADGTEGYGSTDEDGNVTAPVDSNSSLGTSLAASGSTVVMVASAPQVVFETFDFDQVDRWNLYAGILHTIQAIIMFVTAYTVDRFSKFKLPVLNYYLESIDDEDGEAIGLRPVYDRVGKVEFGPVVAMFFVLSALAHFIVICPIEFRNKYLKFFSVFTSQPFNDATGEELTSFKDIYHWMLNRRQNHFRWLEYSISSTLMIFLIAMLFGIYDVGALIVIMMSNASMNLCGSLHETINSPALAKNARTTVNWLPFFIGCITGFAPWIMIFIYIGGSNSTDLPSFVWGILFSYLVFFNTFPCNMVLQYLKVGPWKNYIYGEMGYITLSFVSKTLLAWLVFNGANQPNEYRDD